jgi:hypothetical protein
VDEQKEGVSAQILVDSTKDVRTQELRMCSKFGEVRNVLTKVSVSDHCVNTKSMST